MKSEEGETETEAPGEVPTVGDEEAAEERLAKKLKRFPTFRPARTIGAHPALQGGRFCLKD